LSSLEYARQLVDKASVLVAPGQFFGGFDDHVRVTAARPLEDLKPALVLMSSVLDSMAPDGRNGATHD